MPIDLDELHKHVKDLEGFSLTDRSNAIREMKRSIAPRIGEPPIYSTLREIMQLLEGP